MLLSLLSRVVDLLLPLGLQQSMGLLLVMVEAA